MNDNADMIIEARGIVKKYQDLTAVNGVDFQVRRGEVLGVLGPNGAGKTSMTKMLYNLVRRDSGHLTVFGLDPQIHDVDVKARMGIVPQEDNLDPDLEVRENLEVYANYFGIPKSKARQRIDYLLAFFELEGKEKKNVNALSGGMKRRLVIARALLNEPELLLLDEPTTGLDPAARHLIWDKFRDLIKKGLTILLTTHYMDEAHQLCNRLIIMDKGDIIMQGNPQKLLDAHFEKYVLETECDRAIDVDKGIRNECHGTRRFFYCNDEKTLFSLREKFGDEQVIIRNATLEDLFLKLTGRSLNE